MATINPNPRSEYDDSYVICPYCGEQYGDCWEWVKEHENEMICEECGGVFTHYVEHSASYITRPLTAPQVVVVVDDPVLDVIIADEILEVVDDVLSGVGGVVSVFGDIASGIGDAVSSVFDC
jgi:hypothetical protein